MKKSFLAAACTLAAATVPSLAGAQTTTYTLTYTTVAESDHPSVSFTGTLTAIPSQVAGAFQVTSLTNATRNGIAVTDFDPTSAFYYPAKVPATYQFSTFFDAGQVTLDFFTADGLEYLISRGPSDSSFYHEFEDPFGTTTGRLIQPGSLTLTRNTMTTPAPVPEPASWAMMVAGFAAAGHALRRRRAAGALPASA